MVLVSPDKADGGEDDQIRAVFAHYRTHHPRSYPSPQPSGRHGGPKEAAKVITAKIVGRSRAQVENSASQVRALGIDLDAIKY